MIRKIFFLGIVILIISGCGDNALLEDNTEPFRVKVLSPDLKPVEAATISGGIDWEAFEVQTDSEGIAILPGFARGESALIYRNNFFPKQFHLLPLPYNYIFPLKYIITPTPKQFRLIGSIEGWSIRFDTSTLITVDYHGGYHVYSYNSQGITEIAVETIPIAIRETQLHGDTLWFSTHDDGIYAYSLADPLNPYQLFHLDIPGYLGLFALKNGIIVVDNPWERDALRVYSYNTSGECQKIASFGNYYIKKLAFIGNYLIVIAYSDCLLAIYDLQDPASPYLVYSGEEPEFRSGFLYKNYLILKPRSDSTEEETNYKLIDLYDPINPLTAGFFSADSQLLEIINETTAIGRYNVYTGAISVLSGNIIQGFKTVAIITDNPFIQIFLHESEGCAPPYFIIGECLYKLENR